MKLAETDIGDNLLGFYALSTCELIPFTGGVRLKLDFSDNSGHLPGIMWGEKAEQAYAAIKDAEVIKLKGVVGSYQGRRQIQVEQIRAAEPDEIDYSLLLPTSEFSTEELEVGVSKLIESLEDQELKRLASAVVFDEEIRPLYFRAPGGTSWHHPYIGGLAEHSLSMAQAAAILCDHYSFLDRSLLVTGALLHDVGKIDELHVGSSFSYSTPGRLYGHIVLGYEIVKEKAVELELDEDDNVVKLLHMLLSHQGKKEYSVPVEPCFEEAFVLYFIDEVDSKLNAISRIRSKPENQQREFSAYVNLLGTHLYFGRKEKPEPEEGS